MSTYIVNKVEKNCFPCHAPFGNGDNSFSSLVDAISLYILSSCEHQVYNVISGANMTISLIISYTLKISVRYQLIEENNTNVRYIILIV